jgi:predicted metal-dependent hydrolase
MAFMKEYPREQVEDAREVEASRYDALLNAIWEQCITPGPKQHWALDRAAKLLDQRARLMGWNKPVRQEVSVITENAVDTAIRELQSQLELRAAAAGVKLPPVPAS